MEAKTTTTEFACEGSPDIDESDPQLEEEEEVEEEEVEEDDPNDNVARILKQLQSSGSLIKAPKKEYRCNTCDLDFKDWEEQHAHLVQHVTTPKIILKRVDEDDDDDDEQWSEEEEVPAQKTPQKIDISQLMNKTGLQIKKPGDTGADSTLTKLSGLGFTIKKSSTPATTPVKQENDGDKPANSDIMQRLGQLGGIKLKLKSDGGGSNSFKIINGLKDFKTSDDEDESDKGEDEELDNSGERLEEGAISRKSSESDESTSNKTSNMHVKAPVETTPKKPQNLQNTSTLKQILTAPNPNRPMVKLTPKRISPEMRTYPPATTKITEIPNTNLTMNNKTNDSQRKSNENVEIKKEMEDTPIETVSTPLFSDQIKTERSSPTPSVVPNVTSTLNPVITTVKTENNPDTTPGTTPNVQPLFTRSVANEVPAPLLPVTKTEDSGVTVIEINGDSNDEDDDCCVVSSTPAPDIKPIIPKTEATSTPIVTTTTPLYSSQMNYASTDPSRMPSLLTTEKQHSFNWNAPDSKPAIDLFEKTEDIFDMLSNNKKDSYSADASEYISLDTLGAQHTCDICNLRFTSMSLLEDHIRKTGHSKSVVAPTSNLMPYNPSSGMMLQSLLPVKQLAEQVGKLSAMNNSSQFTHQQNVMINIQAYPGASGMMPPSQQYGAYPGQNMPSYGNAQSNMYGQPQQQMPGQYPNQYGQAGYGQQYPQQHPTYQSTMPQSPYGNMPPTSSYSSGASPLQNMQNMYGQTMNTPQMGQMGHPGQMGPPGMQQQGHQFVSSFSPGGMKLPNTPTSGGGIKIQSVQTISGGQLLGANGQPIAPGQVATASSPAQVRVAGPNNPQIRPRMPTMVRGARPSIRPGVHVQAGARHIRPGTRMPVKRPGAPTNNPGIKRRPDMLLPGKHDNEDCQVMSMQKQREGMPMIHSVQGAKDKLNLGSQISITKKTVNKEASAMANVLASRGISIKQKQKSRSPTPERPIPHIPNLGAGVSIKHTSKSSNFSIPEAKVGGGMYSCKVCRKMFMNPTSLAVHMTAAHPQSKIPVFKCDECPASYPKSLQLQHHKRVFHNVNGPNRELGLPVVDFSQEDNLKRLSNLGIFSYIPLATKEHAPGCFGIPVISVHNMQNGLTTSLQALGADGLLSLGPMKALPS